MAEYILKQAALDALQSAGITRNMRVYKKVQDIQAADVAPMRHGRWEVSDIPGERFKCSECGGGCWHYDYHGCVEKSSYCPHCGAKMDEL